ncbi:rhodanese-like domain-containing protein [Corynebacterium choanae]|uniref:Thiosulfate sulfurtransferase PspE n=1 Tax=Corynebacterium choanae TaxID=1862358 RepID=A0A3G6J741_9CORY|nr:rhodanese-like domain-containing protein [Corynebacterium choanae]AZA12738.1 Thiosulfate sulfurtransferase PspE precursor [Corynebacterium choanae]
MAISAVSVNEVPAGAQIIDVREPDEYQAGHAKGAKNIPVGELPHRLAELDQSQDIYVICHGGGRSSRMCSYLAEQQISAINIDGGTSAWAAAGLAME